MDDRKEDLIEYLVLLKYFQHSSQIGKNEIPLFGNHIL